MTNLRQAAQEALDAWDNPTGIKRLCVAMDALRTALEQQAEPVAWDKPSASFNAWWDSYRHDPANPFAEGSAAYWAWAGWKSAQRQWVGLEAEDLAQIESDEFWQVGNHMAIALAVEAKLKEKNND